MPVGRAWVSVGRPVTPPTSSELRLNAQTAIVVHADAADRRRSESVTEHPVPAGALPTGAPPLSTLRGPGTW